MSIILVRHGQTALNHTRVLQSPETPLDELGLQQAALLAARLAELGAARVICSDHPRARMTAEPVARALGLAPEPEPQLRERNFGDFRGRPHSSFPNGPFAADVEPPDGETWAVFHARIAQVFCSLSERRRALNGNLIVVTHGLVLRSMFEFLVPRGPLAVPNGFDNTSVSILDATAPHTASLINCVRHLNPA